MKRALNFVCSSLAIALALGAPALGALLSVPPETKGPVLVVHWPWQDAAASIIASGGYVLGPVQAPFGLLAASEDAAFATVLVETTPFIVADGYRLARLCGVI